MEWDFVLLFATVALDDVVADDVVGEEKRHNNFSIH